MPYRTHLTTPPGQTPVTEADRSSELYTGSVELPAEPKIPMRFRGQLIALAVLAVLVAGGFAVFNLITAGQDFDPSLDVETPTDEFDPAIPGEEFDPTIPTDG